MRLIASASSHLALGSGLALALAGTVLAAKPSAAVDTVVAAERAFAADALVHGIGGSFVTWAAPDGIVLNPDPTSARALYGAKPAAPPKPGAELKWWPAHAGAARSGDLAFDTGPWVYGDDKAHGWFLTIWKRQPDGAWRWVMDHGADAQASNLGLDGRVSHLKNVDPGPLDPAHAFDRVKAEEAALAADMAKGNLAGAYRQRLGDGAWILGLEPEPLMSADGARNDAVLAALPKRPQTMATEPLGGGASQAGDLAYTFGNAHWTGPDAKPVEGRYVRVWQQQHGHWRIVMDEITPL